MNKLDRQLNLEREMSGLGHRRYEEAVITGREIPDPRHAGEMRHQNSARQSHEESRTDYGRSLLVFSIEGVGSALYQYANRIPGGNGARTVVQKFLLDFMPVDLPCDRKDGEKDTAYNARLAVWLRKRDEGRQQTMRVVAFIGLGVVIDSLSTQVKAVATEMRIGHGLESELKFRFFKRVNPALYEKVFGDLTRREGNFERRKAIMSHSMKTDSSGKASVWQGIERSVVGRVGHFVLNTIIAETKMVEKKTVRFGKKDTDILLVATDGTLELMRSRLDKSGIRNPVFLPSLCSPKKWVHPLTGGYYSAFEELAPVRMVKIASPKRSARRLAELNERRAEMPMVYRAINAVQATPWKINKPLLAVLRDAWVSSGLKIGKMPKRSSADTLAMLFPLGEEYSEELKADLERYVVWKRKRAKVYTDRAVQNSRVIQMERTIAMAEKFQDEETIYFPTQLDFRGRMYAMPSFLNPQGTDVAKGLLTFARGCRLGSSGLRWLAIHIANMHGEDKIGFDERESWTMENMEWIRACVREPFEHREWMDADKPWQFLAGAIEMVAAEEGGYEDFFSHLPVTVDGTCNGLQHFSAMLLDEDGAVAVNLRPSEVPNDIYQIVADKVKGKFASMEDPMAKAWLQWGFDRKATKRAVMILPYSGTQHAAKEYIRDYVKEREDERPWEDDYQATIFFAQHVWSTIGETIESAGLVMKWLQMVASEVTKANEIIRWKTPINFLVEQF